MQHAHHYAPLGARSALIPVAHIGSRFGVWLILGGFLLGAFAPSTAANTSAGIFGLRQLLLYIGVAAFSMGFVVSLVTLPVEFNASRRAMNLLPQVGVITTTQERQAVSKALMAAASTYVAAALGSFLQVLYWLIRLGILRGRD